MAEKGIMNGYKTGEIAFQWNKGQGIVKSWSGFHEISPGMGRKLIIAHTWNRVCEKTNIPHCKSKSYFSFVKGKDCSLNKK